ncbi:MAG: hypothetical protein ACE5GV_07525, partial [Candidatus Scalindua sp.]
QPSLKCLPVRQFVRREVNSCLPVGKENTYPPANQFGQEVKNKRFVLSHNFSSLQTLRTFNLGLLDVNIRGYGGY